MAVNYRMNKVIFSMHKILLVLVVSTCMTGMAAAQVTISEESSITNLMQTYKSENKKKTIVRAWRIQILTTNDRREMELGIKEFQKLYPDMDYKWEHNPPYYQVRTGAYELRDDLEAKLLELKRDFPSAIPVQAEMKKRELLKY